jgi:hypothetical protein
VARWSGDERSAAVAAELAPYAWRNFTEFMLARRVVGVTDRDGVVRFLTGLPGTDVGGWAPVEPADLGDERVDVLVQVLESRRWRGMSLERLCVDLLAALDAWVERAAARSSPRNTLDDR